MHAINDTAERPQVRSWQTLGLMEHLGRHIKRSADECVTTVVPWAVEQVEIWLVGVLGGCSVALSLCTVFCVALLDDLPLLAIHYFLFDSWRGALVCISTRVAILPTVFINVVFVIFGISKVNLFQKAHAKRVLLYDIRKIDLPA